MDTELLICMVRDRPVLWDKNCSEYKSKSHSRDAWAEICSAFDPDFQTLSPEEQLNIQTTVSKKWCNVRDSWMKWRRKAGNRKLHVRKYIYSENLEFLQSTLDTTDIESPSDVERASGGRERTSRTLPPAAAKRGVAGEEEGSEGENRHLSFFRSVLPSMSCFTDDETLEFQMGVLTSIQSIKKKRLRVT